MHSCIHDKGCRVIVVFFSKSWLGNTFQTLKNDYMDPAMNVNMKRKDYFMREWRLFPPYLNMLRGMWGLCIHRPGSLKTRRTSGHLQREIELRIDMREIWSGLLTTLWLEYQDYLEDSLAVQGSTCTPCSKRGSNKQPSFESLSELWMRISLPNIY